MKMFFLRLCFIVLPVMAFLVPFSGNAAQPSKVQFDLTGNNMSTTFEKFMRCNAGELPLQLCTADFASAEFLFDAETVKNLQKYHFILIPGGEFDFFGELLDLCEGQESDDFDNFEYLHPELGDAIEHAIVKDACPAYEANDTSYYHEFMGSYQDYVYFFRDNNIPNKWLAYYLDDPPTYIGDRVHKLDMVADTIDYVEAEGNGSQKNYVLMGHSFGGLNIADFLVELVGGHAPNTPEYKLLENTKVRTWPADKKQKIFNKIKGAAFLNTFVQGDGSPETRLNKIAEEDGIQAADPVAYYINYVLENYPAGKIPDTTRWKQIVSDTLLTSRYRTNYYLKDKNTLAENNGNNIQAAFDRIAEKVAIISIGCVVPRMFPELRVDPNFLVYKSKKKWHEENMMNDGMVDSYASIFPRESVDYAILFKHDHGTLVMKPQVPGITSAHEYDQTPFLKTLLKRMESKLKAFQNNASKLRNK
ncbi:MAG: hypothetical protein NTZ51_11365 [Proteobacteria bacterium]|nr:hypothetical protein [Pseudomonadota bacterium]